MKTSALFICTGIFLIFSATASAQQVKNKGVSSITRKNLEISEAIGKCFETKDFSRLGDYLAADFIDYAGMNGPVKGVEENKKAFEQMSAMMDSTTMTTVVALGNDEYTMLWIRMKGKMKTDPMGTKPAQWIEGNSVEVTQFKNGKAIAHWTYMDPADMAKMMGNMPPSGTAPAN